MMKQIQIILLILSFLAFLIFGHFRPVQGQSGSFTIENADATNTLDVTSSSELETLIDQVAPRFVMEFANANQVYTLTSLPIALDDLLETIQPRFVMEFANAQKVYDLTPIPSQLDTFLGQIGPRFILEYANANREIDLSYPIGMIGDSEAPQGSGIEVETTGAYTATVSWTTDEYANSVVECGTESGTYTMTFSDTLYVKVHAVTLTGLTPETTYYCRISSADLSGNTYQSQAFSFKQSVRAPATLTKRVSPEGQVLYGDELTYTLVISGVPGTAVGLYDPLTSTTFVRFDERPTSVEHANHAITGTLTITPTNQVTVSFVAQVGAPETMGVHIDVSNRACLYAVGQTINECQWSDPVTNRAYRPHAVFLPLVMRD
jgi:hypothetical protein